MIDRKTIGVLGGMGPMATVEFFRRLVEATPAGSDQDHLHILIDNDPSVPNRTDALLHDGPTPVPTLQAMAHRLADAGAQVLAMPCNTGHAYIDDIRAAVDVPIIDMIAETARATSSARIGLLATDGTIESGLYHRAFHRHGIDVVVPGPDDRRTVMAAIAAIKAGEPLTPLEDRIAAVVGRLADAGAEAAIAACTELSLLSRERMPVRWIDALDVLVRSTLRAAGVRIGEGEENA